MIKKKTLYTLLLNYITKNGNKVLYTIILNKALRQASKKARLHPTILLIRLFKALRTFVEIRDVRRRRKTFKIPFPISLSRQKYLSIK